MNILDPVFWFYFLYFFVAVFFAFYIPGDIILRRFSLSNFHRFALGIILGMALWGWQGFIFGHLDLRWLTYIYLLITFIIWAKYYIKKGKHNPLRYLKRVSFDWLLITLIAFGSIIQITTVW